MQRFTISLDDQLAAGRHLGPGRCNPDDLDVAALSFLGGLKGPSDTQKEEDEAGQQDDDDRSGLFSRRPRSGRDRSLHGGTLTRR